MKKIGIDARLCFKTGVGTYLQNLLHFLDKKDLNDEIFYVYLLPEDFGKVNFKNKKIIKRKADFAWHSVSEQFGFAKMLYGDELDLMHFTYFSYPIFYFRKFIATLHDTTPLMFRTGKASTKNPILYMIKHFVFKIVIWMQVNNAKIIITPTLTVKKQLSEIYGALIDKKTVTIYEGINYKFTNIQENKLLFNKYHDFLIYVGNFYPHKNVERLVSVFSKIKTQSTLILIGPDDYFSHRINKLVEEKKSRNRISIIRNPSLSDLLFFYKNAKGLIHPSLSEGFGLPIVEAMSFNLPVVASNIAVFKELMGNQYLPFDPLNEEDIKTKIIWFLDNNPKYRYDDIIKKFSFTKMTDETLKLYRKGL